MTKFPKIKFIFALVIPLFIFGAVSLYAQPGPAAGGTNSPAAGGTNNPGTINANLPNPFSGGDSLFALLKTIINEIILPIGGVIAVLAFIYSGFQYVMAQGNETKLATAHKSLLYTSIGTAVLLGSWVLANVICTTIGLLGGPVCPT